MRRFSGKFSKWEQHPDEFLVAFVRDKYWYEKEYLTGALWKSIREGVLKNASYKCACCPANATEVHHRDYRPRVLSGDDISPLVALCRRCHRWIDEVKGKYSWNEFERLLAELVAAEDTRVSDGDTVVVELSKARWQFECEKAVKKAAEEKKVSRRVF